MLLLLSKLNLVGKIKRYLLEGYILFLFIFLQTTRNFNLLDLCHAICCISPYLLKCVCLLKSSTFTTHIINEWFGVSVITMVFLDVTPGTMEILSAMYPGFHWNDGVYFYGQCVSKKSSTLGATFAPILQGRPSSLPQLACRSCSRRSSAESPAASWSPRLSGWLASQWIARRNLNIAF